MQSDEQEIHPQEGERLPLFEPAQAEDDIVAKGAFFAISVENFNETISWYTEHLNFTVESQGENDQRRGALLVRPGAVLEIAAFADARPRSSFDPELESHQVHGIFKLGFVVKDLDSTYQSLSSAGVEVFFPIVEASDGRRTFGVKDPEGNIVQFFGQ